MYKHVWLTGLLIVGPPLTGLAAPSDRSEPIEIEADSKSTDYQSGIGIYRGNVIITQGSLRATGDTVTIHVVDGELDRAQIEGRPATFRELDEQGREIRGQANEAEYLAREQKLRLLGDAEIERDGDLLQSQRIDYDMVREVVEAQGEKDGDRVRLILTPRSGDSTP